MKKVRCTDWFYVDTVDGDGFTIGEQGFEVKEGTIWEIDEGKSRIVGGEVRLLNDDFGWIEICEETFENHFVEVS